MMNLTLTYDHRLVDGALAGRFLRDLRERLQTWGETDYSSARGGSDDPDATSHATLGTVEYREALELQRAIAAAVAEGALPDTVLLLEHPPTITLGRRTDEASFTCPTGPTSTIVETDRGGKSTYHAPGQLVCYPILDLTRHGQDVKKYCRDLEEALIRTLAAFGDRGDADRGPDRASGSSAAAEDRVDRHPPLEVGVDARLRAERRPRPGAVHRLDHRLRARRLPVHVDGARARAAAPVDDVRPAAAQALADVFGFAFEELPSATVLRPARPDVPPAFG